VGVTRPAADVPYRAAAAVYRVGGQDVRAVNGIPPSASAYVAEVGQYIGEFSERQ